MKLLLIAVISALSFAAISACTSAPSTFCAAGGEDSTQNQHNGCVR